MLELVRFKELTTAELAPQLHDAAQASRAELKARFSPGTIRRLGSDALTARNTVERAIRQDDESETHRGGRATFAVVERGTAGNAAIAVGAATVMTRLRLYVHHLPLPPRITDHLPSPGVRTEALYGHANVTGWTTPEHYGELDSVYRRLIEEVPQPYGAWTVEPVRSDPLVHAAIRRAGLVPHAGGPERYDVGEARSVVPPLAQAYVTPR